MLKALLAMAIFDLRWSKNKKAVDFSTAFDVAFGGVDVFRIQTQ
jgi:hypothetical protein